MSSPKSLSQFVEPRLTEQRRAQQFEQIAEGLGRSHPLPRRAWPVLAVVGALGLAAALFAIGQRSAQRIEAPADVAVLEGDSMTLLDGSRVTLDASGKLRLATLTPSAIRLVLERGAVDVDASHVPGRSFVVVAAGYEVRVVGTRFRVVRDGDGGVLVSVERGRVEVRRDGGTDVVQVLDAGQSWSVALEHAKRPVEPQPKSAPPAPATPEPSSTPAKSVAPTAKQLFERAQAARARGQLDEAAAAFRSLRRLYPDDPRASLAAFELARIELDSKGNPKEAARALKDAIDSAPPGAPHREDAEARRVEALDAAGDRAGCLAARDAYLSRYPKGVHRAQVSARCKER